VTRAWCALLGLLEFLSAPSFALPSERGEHPSFLASAAQRISAPRMAELVARLSGPEFHGRLTGTPDDFESARFVATQFSVAGLQPLFPQAAWMMAVEVAATRIAENPAPQFRISSAESSHSIEMGSAYLPMLDSPSIDLTAPFVFVGYGIADPAHGWDDYAGVDVRNRVVAFLRGKPESYAYPLSHADKVRMARGHGAAAFLTFSGPIMSPYEARRGMGHAPLAFYNQTSPDSSLPGAWIHTDLAEQLLSGHLAAMGRSWRDVQQFSHPAAPHAFETTTPIRLKWERSQEKGTLHNVVGCLLGTDPSLADDTIVIGAHRDHFGQQADLLFPGADDNASGTAVLLEVARALIESGAKPRRSILFVSFSGEEQGLLGSRLYVDRPARPLAKTVAMIKIDHAGVGNGRLTVGVTGLEHSAASAAGLQAGLADRLDLYGFFPGGDHVPFKEAGVPTLTVVSGGAHPHYHQPSDTSDTIRPDILERTARYVLALVWQLAN
jgi:hypothetical protein